MSLIAKQEPKGKKRNVNVFVVPSASALLEQYKAFLQGDGPVVSSAYVIEHLLLQLPKLDKEFQQWRQTQNLFTLSKPAARSKAKTA